MVSQFDFVGIAEQLPETMAGLARLYAKTPAGMGILARDIGIKVRQRVRAASPCGIHHGPAHNDVNPCKAKAKLRILYSILYHIISHIKSYVKHVKPQC